MQFAASGWHFGVWIAAWIAIPLMIGLVIREHRLKKRDGGKFGDLNMLWRLFPDEVWKTESDVRNAHSRNQLTRAQLVKRSIRRRSNVKTLLFFLGVLAIVLALGRPQWGSRQEKIYKKGIDIVFLVDTSYSMKAEDVAPSRLSKAESEISTLLRHLGNNRAALVGFASTTRLHCPLTLDFRGLKSILKHSLTLGPGTNIQEGVEASLRALRDSKALSKAIIILSDGEGHTGDIDKTIEEVKNADVKIYSIGIGTPEGGPIPEKTASGTAGYKKKNGELVWTKLDEETLTRLARETGGEYYRATIAGTEAESIANSIAGLQKTKFSQTVKTSREDQFSVFLLIAATLLALEFGFGEFRRISWENEDA